MSTCFNNLSQLPPPPPACERVTSLSASQTKWPPWPKTRTLNFFLYWALISLVIKKILKRRNLREEKMLATISYQLQPEKTLYSENKIITMSWPSPNLNGLELNNKKNYNFKEKITYLLLLLVGFGIDGFTFSVSVRVLLSAAIVSVRLPTVSTSSSTQAGFFSRSHESFLSSLPNTLLLVLTLLVILFIGIPSVFPIFKISRRSNQSGIQQTGKNQPPQRIICTGITSITHEHYLFTIFWEARWSYPSFKVVISWLYFDIRFSVLRQSFSSLASETNHALVSTSLCVSSIASFRGRRV